MLRNLVSLCGEVCNADASPSLETEDSAPVAHAEETTVESEALVPDAPMLDDDAVVLETPLVVPALVNISDSETSPAFLSQCSSLESLDQVSVGVQHISTSDEGDLAQGSAPGLEQVAATPPPKRTNSVLEAEALTTPRIPLGERIIKKGRRGKPAQAPKATAASSAKKGSAPICKEPLSAFATPSSIAKKGRTPICKELPEGWTVTVHVRHSGKMCGKTYNQFLGPKGEIARSYAELSRLGVTS